jgi:transposase
MKRWDMIHKIKSLYDDGNGCSIRTIANKLEISRNTVRKYLRMNEDIICENFQNTERTKELDQFKAYIIYLLKKYDRLSAVKIRRKLEKWGINLKASNRTLRRYVRDVKKTITVKQKRYYEPVGEMPPGVQCQVDPGELRTVSVAGKPIAVYFIVFVLSFSRLMYVAASRCPINTQMFINMHDEAFSYFGGVTEECVYDQTKLVAIKEEFREVWFNERFHQYTTAAHFDIRVCEGFDPESKGKVEAGVKYVKNNFFYGESFDSFKTLKSELREWMEKIANIRIHGTTAKIPQEVYRTIEQSEMNTYFQPACIKTGFIGDTRNVDKTSLISHKSNKYSVPMEYQSSIVGIQTQGAGLFIYSLESNQLIAKHDICEGCGNIIKNTNHYRDHKKRIVDLEKEVIAIIGSEIGNSICTVIKATSPKIYKDQLTGLIKVFKQFDTSDIKEPLNILADRTRLTVTFIRDYLTAFCSRKEKIQSYTINKPENNIELLSRYRLLLAHQPEIKEAPTNEYI